ncbi:mechanosensitive ion channel [Thiomicrospira microaerophila]|uniref:mechanosensitive ion channel family protein n=1 Tax=Thiomicrospira microaerophila TaxID=406020 RepID=UPI00200D5490|nr:mechanosensitive ion channel domain-containing protein [Thiomicrospira microaerophila]UQB42379.1 mechanosensitive ion channel [Thiomicrospira microaerophila]
MEFENILNQYVIPFGIQLLVAIVAFYIGNKLIGLALNLLDKILVKFEVQPILVSFSKSVAKGLLYVILTIAILSYLGFDTTSVVAILAAASLAIGLALKDSLNNFASGVMLILTKPFKVGDFVEVGGQMGVVEGLQLFSTAMRTGDNRQVIIPNGQIYNSAMINYSAKPTRRIDLVFGISYDSDLRKAKTILQDLIQQETRALTDPEPLVVVSELADSSVNFTVRIWVDSADYWAVRFDYIEKVKLTFDENDIVIPYPQMDVHVQGMPTAA